MLIWIFVLIVAFTLAPKLMANLALIAVGCCIVYYVCKYVITRNKPMATKPVTYSQTVTTVPTCSKQAIEALKQLGMTPENAPADILKQIKDAFP